MMDYIIHGLWQSVIGIAMVPLGLVAIMLLGWPILGVFPVAMVSECKSRWPARITASMYVVGLIAWMIVMGNELP